MDLVICEIFNKKIHGFDDNNDPTVVGHYMVSYNFKLAISGDFLYHHYLPTIPQYLHQP